MSPPQRPHGQTAAEAAAAAARLDHNIAAQRTETAPPVPVHHQQQATSRNDRPPAYTEHNPIQNAATANQPNAAHLSSTSQYHLSNDNVAAAAAANSAIPVLQHSTADDTDDDDLAGGAAGGNRLAAAPPPYDENDYKLPIASAIGKLPTYEEVEREKAERAEARRPAPNGGGATTTVMTTTSVHCPAGMRVITIGGTRPTNIQIMPDVAGALGASGRRSVGGDPDPEQMLVTDDALLGTDLMFVAAFLVAFMFNWMGFLLITCACQNIAARYGSLSGFGLSLAKWTMIVKSSSTTLVTSEENAWLWWLIMSFGLLICVRSAVQYVGIKRSWRGMTVAGAERMLIYDH